MYSTGFCKRGICRTPWEIELVEFVTYFSKFVLKESEH